jgi:hypothetical protein
MRLASEALGGELGVEQEAARADGQHLRAIANDDERAPVSLQDSVEPLAQWRPGRNGRERLLQCQLPPVGHAVDASG